MIEVTNVSWLSVLKEINLNLETGKFYSVIGPNGAGKSSLLNIIAGSRQPSKGGVQLNGQRVNQQSAMQLAKQRAVMPQAIPMAFSMPLHEVVMMGAMCHTTLNTKAKQQLVLQCLHIVGLQEATHANYALLSGGQQQRVQLARVLAQLGPIDAAKGKWLLLDEATASLDLQYQHQVFAIAKALTERGIGVLAIVHDMNLAAKYSDQLICMQGGAIKQGGSVLDVLTPELIFDLYGLHGGTMLDHEQQVQLMVSKKQFAWRTAS